MTINGLVQIGLYFVVLLALAKPLGWYMARVYEGQPCGLDRVVGPLERLIYRLCGVRQTEEMDWKTYGIAMLLFNAMGLVALYALQRLQGFLPLNPAGLGAVTTDLAFNTAASFATNTNWQAYGGETTLSYLTQMLGLTVQNFVSAATGMAILVALIRGLARRSATTIGNFWTDLVRSTLYILLPLALLLSLLLVSQGVVQTFASYQTATLLQPASYAKPVMDANGQPVLDEQGQPKTEPATATEQVLAVGPAASQIAIKQLGTNGGGFFNVNSAHPFENADALVEFPRGSRDPAHPGGALLHVRDDGRRYAPGLGAPCCDDDSPALFYSAGAMGRAKRESGFHRSGDRSGFQCRTIRREHGRERDAIRYRQLRPVVCCDDGRFKRLGKFDARFVYPFGRTRAALPDAVRGSGVRRGRLGSLRDDRLRHHCCVRGRTDGGTNT